LKVFLLQTAPDVLGWCWHLALLIDIVLLPLALSRRARIHIGWLLAFSSFVFGASLWFMSALITFTLWGTFALIVGLFLLGLGVVPMAIIAAAMRSLGGDSRYWSVFGFQLFLLLLTFGARGLGLYFTTTDINAEIQRL
jgi:hypothetical protein